MCCISENVISIKYRNALILSEEQEIIGLSVQMERIWKTFNQTRLVLFLLTVLVLVVYWDVPHFDFVHYDDHVYVTDHVQVRQGLNTENLKWALTSTEAGFWHPLTWLSLMLDYQFFGLNPGGYHFTNLLLHLTNTLLLFLVFASMTGAVWRSAFVAALFAVHPLHVESVAWIAERKDVLCGLFWILAVGAYARYAERPSWVRYAAVFVTLLLGLASKAMAVTLPFVLLLLDIWPLGRLRLTEAGRGSVRASRSILNEVRDGVLDGKSTGRFSPAPIGWLILEKVPLVLLSAVVGILTWVAESKVGALKTVAEYPLTVRLGNAVVSYVRYLGKMFWPADLAVIYPHPGTWPWVSVALAAFVLVTIMFFVLRFRRRAPYLAIGWFWYLGALVPVIGLVQIGSHAMADRYTYLPLIGLFIMIAWGMTDLLAPRRFGRTLLTIGAIAVVMALIPPARAQVAYWVDAEHLFRRAVAVTERNYLAHNNLGAALASKGCVDEALRHYREALAIRPRYPEALFNAGSALAAQGHYAEAEAYYRSALEIHPGLSEAHNNLAIALTMQGKMHDAIRHFRTALHLRPGYIEAKKNLALALRGVKRKSSDYQ